MKFSFFSARMVEPEFEDNNIYYISSNSVPRIIPYPVLSPE